MNVIQLSAEERAKSLSRVGKDLGLHERYAAPDQHSATLIALARHVDELRMRLHFVEIEPVRFHARKVRSIFSNKILLTRHETPEALVIDRAKTLA